MGRLFSKRVLHQLANPKFARPLLDTLNHIKLNSKHGSTRFSNFTSANIMCLYFSASWCQPCLSLTPKLIKLYHEVNFDQKELEILFVSSDRTSSQYNTFFSEMPWLAVPFEDIPTKMKLKRKYQLEELPTLILINGKGDVLKEEIDRDLIEKNKSSSDVIAKWRQITIDDKNKS